MSAGMPADHLPYPLPPWKHSFRTLSVFCEVDEARLRPLIPAPLELRSTTVQVTVMFFDCTVPERPYYDSAVIAPVRFGGVDGGYWVYGYTSTDQVLSGTREIWGFKMKLAEMELEESSERVSGRTTRLGKTIVDVTLTPSDHRFTPPNTFPRLFYKVIPQADRASPLAKQIVMMAAETDIKETIMGDGAVRFEPSDADPLSQLEPTNVIGASLIKGEQTLVWGEILAELD
jgi:acetoacetate decarboxylase